MGYCLSKEKKASKSGSFVRTKQSVRDLKKQYDLDHRKFLGRGQFGKVFLAKNIKDPTIKVAIKVVSKKGMTQEELDELMEEVKMLRDIDHPNIVKYYESYDDIKYFYVVMEFCAGGELLARIVKTNRAMCEYEAALEMKKILLALQHCHSQGIMHRDIKPENIMFGEDGSIKLIDFGFAIKCNNRRAPHPVAGTPYYIAPEVLDSYYGIECDIWSLGVVIYQLLSGKMPFESKSMDGIFEKIRVGKFKMPDFISEDARDLIKKMIVVDPNLRITALEALSHPWIKQTDQKEAVDHQKEHELSAQVVNNLKKYKGQSLLKHAAMNVLVKHLHPNEIKSLTAEFEKLDTDKSGFLEYHELEQALLNSKYQESLGDLKKIIKELDYAKNEKISYSEFIAGSIDVSKFLTKEKLEALFNTFDVDNTGQITAANIKSAFSKFNRHITDEEIKTIMKEHDIENNGVIKRHEFEKMMMGVL